MKPATEIVSHPKALVCVINTISLHPALSFCIFICTIIIVQAPVKVNAPSPQLETNNSTHIQMEREGETEKDRDSGRGSHYRCAFLQPVE